MKLARRAETAGRRGAVPPRRWFVHGIVVAVICFAVASCAKFAGPDTTADDAISITADASFPGPFTGRLLLFFITDTGKRLSMRPPLDGPFLDNPQPIASIAVENWNGSDALKVTDLSAIVFNGPLDGFNGPVRVQAVLHVRDDRPRMLAGPGCLYSGVVNYEARSDAADSAQIKLTSRINDPGETAGRDNLKWVEVENTLITGGKTTTVHQRAAVALPAEYDAKPDALWPVVYIIPDRVEDTLNIAAEWADTLLIPGIDEVAPHAVHVVLDPQTAFGHHGFVDSTFHGKRGALLIEQLIPKLEKEFRIAPRKEARIVTGSGLGGWSALWLQLNYPETFGACWVSAPTPIGFSFFQTLELYKETNAFEDESMQPTYAYRRTGMKIDEMIPSMTLKQMSQMERAIDPEGRSGGLYDTFEAMYSPIDPATGKPRPLFDRETGALDKEVIRHWRNYDLAERIVNDWPKYRPILLERVHLTAADFDSYYFDVAVRSFMERIRTLEGGDDVATQSFRIVVGATHENLQRHIFARWNDEIRNYFNRNDVDVE